MDLYKFLTGRWGASVYLFALTLIVSIALALARHTKRNHLLTPGKTLFVGVFLSAFVYFIPLYLDKGMDTFTTVLNSFQNAFRMFALDGEFVGFVVQHVYSEENIKELYVGYGSVLSAFAPLLTFGFILTFFKNFFAHLKYKSLFWVNTHVFSELNEKSLALAKSILRKNKPILRLFPRALIIFTDIMDKEDELNLDLVEEAKGIGAILFRKDLKSIHFRQRISCRSLKFYLISDNESEKIRHAESIIKSYDYKKVGLWIFSDNIRTELMLARHNVENMQIKRVNDIQSLIYHNLDKYGHNLFGSARKTDGNNVISAVIIGLGKYGREMLKALTWYCQLDGYKLKINAFDSDERAKEKFIEQCPELMSDDYNKKRIEGEPYYEIDVHNGIDVSVPEFENQLKKITDATYIFVCLGDDETNLGVASKIRSICERVDYIGDGRKPAIETVIYNSDTGKKLGTTWEAINASETNRKKKRYEYDILMIGDLDSFYSEDTVIDSDLMTEGFETHTFWSTEPAKLSFAEDYMESEWLSFIESEKLEDSWQSHYVNTNHEKNEVGQIKLSVAIDSFSFMTAKEEKEISQSPENNKRLMEIKNAVAERADRWEKLVYSKFNALMSTPALAKKWKRINAEKMADAERSFRLEYNYRSSIAKAIHKRLRIKLAFKPHITQKAWEDMTLVDKVEIGKIEHVRWNAYMRTEGYRYAEKRNDLARLHNNLVPVSKLSNDDLRKDA